MKLTNKQYIANPPYSIENGGLVCLINERRIEKFIYNYFRAVLWIVLPAKYVSADCCDNRS